MGVLADRELRPQDLQQLLDLVRVPRVHEVLHHLLNLQGSRLPLLVKSVNESSNTRCAAKKKQDFSSLFQQLSFKVVSNIMRHLEISALEIGLT